MKTSMVLLVTEDSATASAAKSAARELHQEIVHLTCGSTAISTLMDDVASFDFAVIDIDRHTGNRACFQTAAGLLPVVAVSRPDHAETSQMERRCHAVAHLSKPVKGDQARAAFLHALTHRRPE